MARSGILLVDKSEGFTSHDVVSRTRKLLDTRKIGHAGTLDPMATGLLVLGANSSTRLLTYLVGLDKVYETVIRLGVATVTDDREGETTAVAAPGRVDAITREQLLTEVARLTGDILQSPSAVSAIKVDGRRAYDRVRAGETVELKRRPVTVHAFELGEAALSTLPDGTRVLDIPATVHCSTGTYIRALARDLGEALGVGGHLIALRRTRVGPFSVADARTVASLSGEGASVTDSILPPARVAATLFPELALSAEQAVDLGHGKKLSVPGVADAPLAAAIGPGDALIGLVRVRNETARVVVNFPTSHGGSE